MRKKRVLVIHTSPVSIENLKNLFRNIIPEAEVFNLIDDSLLAEVMESNHVTPGIINRMANYIKSAETIGADTILSQCSSMGPAIDIVSKNTRIPILKIDLAMAEKAVSLGKKIAVVATVASTMKPSCDLIRQAALNSGKEITIIEVLVDGALDILLKEADKEKHNKLVLDKIKGLDGKCDVIVLAQGSMVVLSPYLNQLKTPALTSPELGVRKMRDLLGLE